MSDISNISSVTSSAKAFRLTSRTEVSMESISTQERVMFSSEGTSISGDAQKIKEGLAMSSEIRGQLEAQLEQSYFGLFVSANS